MGFDWRYEDSDKLEVFLGNLETDCQQAGERIQKKSGEIIKAKMVSQLNRIRTSYTAPSRSNKNPSPYKHMADDVTIRTVKDGWGDTVVKVSGGKKTGTLWHIVNDGTYRSRATHFMDKGMAEAEPEVLAIIDAELSKVGD